MVAACFATEYRWLNKASVIYPNGIITEYGYGNLNRLISVETRTLMSDIIASYAYTLNAKGQRTHVEERVGTQLVRTIDYTYDAANRLTEEQIDDVITGVRTITYTYDPVGNRLTKDDNGVITTYSYDDNDRLLMEGGFSYGYDDNGNLLSKTGNGEQYNFSYNALNQLVHADIDTGTGSSSVDYVYDHDGIRVGKTLNGTDVIKYVVDKNRPYAQVLEEQWSNGALSATTGYVYGENLISQTSNGTPHFFHYDGMGSTRILTDMTGTVTDTYSYDAYGNLLDKTGSTINPYLYRGEQYDDDLSSYYLRARYYQPGIGRFLTTDPVEGFPNNPMTLHRYLYGSCDPVNHIDPSGEMDFVEALATTLILNVVAGIAVETNFMGLQDLYVFLAKYCVVDASILGVSVNTSGPFKPVRDVIIEAIKALNSRLPIQIPIHTTPDYEKKVWGDEFLGYELLFSVSSAEIALFKVRGVNVLSLPFYFGSCIYEGGVYNLWNAKNYSGPFASVGLFGKSLFFSPDAVFMGPWGIGQDLFSWDISRAIKSFSFSKNSVGVLTNYTLVGYPLEYGSEYEVAETLMGITFVLNLFKCSLPQNMLFSITAWFQTATAKHYWNKRDNHSVQRRQQTENRPPEFQSGPGLIVFSQHI